MTEEEFEDGMEQCERCGNYGAVEHDGVLLCFDCESDFSDEEEGH